MSNALSDTDFDALSLDEQVEYVQTLWEKITQNAANLELSPEHRAELDRRLADYEANPDDVIPWEEVRERLLRK